MDVTVMPYPLEKDWYQSHDNVLTLIRYMADTGRSASQIVYAVEKPWKHEDDFRAAKLAEAQEDAGA